MNIGKRLLAGLAAGAAGTTALNTVTYLDMAIRGRGTSSTPEDTVEAMATKTGSHVPGGEESRKNRDSGLGALLGILAGLGVGAVLGAAHGVGRRPNLAAAALLTGLGAMIATDAPMAALGVSDPRTWQPADWASDALPHLAYGLTTAAVVRALSGS
ncbi:MAG: hypothetical protein ACR2M5_02090 [Nakamurella sp.]